MSPASVFFMVSWPLTGPKDIPEPSHGRVLQEMLCSVHVEEGDWSFLTELFFNRIMSYAFIILNLIR